jgi:hypothetical protein
MAKRGAQLGAALIATVEMLPEIRTISSHIPPCKRASTLDARRKAPARLPAIQGAGHRSHD